MPPLSKNSPASDANGDAQGNSRETATGSSPTQSAELDLPSFLPFDAAPDLFPELSESKAAGAAAALTGGSLPPSVQLETTGITSQITGSYEAKKKSTNKNQSEFWQAQTCHKESIISKLLSLNRNDLTAPLENCHQEAHYAKCNSCSSVKVLLNRCDRFYCPECQPGLSRDRRRQVEWWANEISQPKHVVLTLQNVPTLSKAYVKQAKSWLAGLRRRAFCRNWKGGFYSLEVTNEKKGTHKRGVKVTGGWHLHFHLLVDARFIDDRVLSAQWHLATHGRGRIVKVSDCRRADYLAEVTKYAVKGNQLAAWKAADIASFIDAFTGVRTFGVFGSLYGKRTAYREWFNLVSKQALTCKCGCCDFTIHTDLEWKLMQEGIPLHLVRGP
jgi:hypothetical protein